MITNLIKNMIMEIPWLSDVYKAFNKNVIKWKWFPTVAIIGISLILYIVSGYFLLEEKPANKLWWLQTINNLCLAFIAGGTFTAIIKFFQFNRVFKDELKEVLLEEDLHIEKSRKHRDNIFVNSLSSYSRGFIKETLDLMVERLFPKDFSKILDTDFHTTMSNRLYRELSPTSKNNFVQKKCTLKYEIRKFTNEFLILEQEISSELVSIGNHIIFSRSFSNWIPQKSNLEHFSVKVKKFTFDNIDYSDRFKVSSDTNNEYLEYNLKKEKIEIKTEINKKKVEFSSKMEFYISLKTFLYWEYKFDAYTKGVIVKLKYNKKDYQGLIMEFAQQEKLIGQNGETTYKHNSNTIYLPEDKFMLAISPS